MSTIFTRLTSIAMICLIANSAQAAFPSVLQPAPAPAPERIWGADDRVEVTEEMAKAFDPLKRVMKIHVSWGYGTDPNGHGLGIPRRDVYGSHDCTAYPVAIGVYVSAAHCVDIVFKHNPTVKPFGYYSLYVEGPYAERFDSSVKDRTRSEWVSIAAVGPAYKKYLDALAAGTIKDRSQLDQATDNAVAMDDWMILVNQHAIASLVDSVGFFHTQPRELVAKFNKESPNGWHLFGFQMEKDNRMAFIKPLHTKNCNLFSVKKDNMYGSNNCDMLGGASGAPMFQCEQVAPYRCFVAAHVTGDATDYDLYVSSNNYAQELKKVIDEHYQLIADKHIHAKFWEEAYVDLARVNAVILEEWLVENPNRKAKPNGLLNMSATLDVVKARYEILMKSKGHDELKVNYKREFERLQAAYAQYLKRAP